MAATPDSGGSASRQQPPRVDENPQAATLEKERRFQEAEEQLKAGKTAPGISHNATQKSSQLPLSDTRKNQAQTGSQQADPRSQVFSGSPETGYSGTWTDPATGDIITSVIAPAPQATGGQYQNYPMIIEPQVVGSDYYGSSWNYGAQSSWPQWPGYPGDSGYPAPTPPPPPTSQFPYPSQPMPGPVPPPLGPVDQPPPFPPSYRPLRPLHPGQGWNQGMPNNPGFVPATPNNPAVPGNPGFNPPLANPALPGNPGFVPPGNPGFIPPQNNHGYVSPGNPGFNPAPPNGIGYNPAPFPVGPGNPGLQPAPGPLPNGPGPGFRPLPMTPGGQPMGGGRR